MNLKKEFLQKSIGLMKSQDNSEKQEFLNVLKNEEIVNALNLNMQLKQA